MVLEQSNPGRSGNSLPPEAVRQSASSRPNTAQDWLPRPQAADLSSWGRDPGGFWAGSVASSTHRIPSIRICKDGKTWHSCHGEQGSQVFPSLLYIQPAPPSAPCSSLVFSLNS